MVPSISQLRLLLSNLTLSVAKKLKYRLKPGGVQFGEGFRVVMKLKYHRLKPGGVQFGEGFRVAMKLKYRLKPGGVRDFLCKNCRGHTN